MQKNKLFYLLSTGLVLSSLVFSSVVLANNGNNNDKSGEDHGNSEQAQEAHQRGSTMEVHISNAGKVNVQGAKVTAISGNTVSASTSWGAVSLNWSVNVLSDTHFNRKLGTTSSIGEISVGDIVGFQGNLVTTSSSPFIVNATMIKDWSVLKTNMNDGTIKSISATTLPVSMVVTFGDKDYTVNLATDTSILNSSWLKVALSSFKVGDKVKIYGVVNATNFSINATVVKDTSL